MVKTILKKENGNYEFTRIYKKNNKGRNRTNK